MIPNYSAFSHEGLSLLLLLRLKQMKIVAVAFGIKLIEWNEAERGGVDAIAQIRRRRPVVKDVAQVPITPFAGYRSAYAPAVVFCFHNVLFGDGLPEARPAGTGIELRLRRKQRRITADAAKDSSLVQVPVRAGVGHLCIGPAGYVECVGGKLSFPLRVALDDLRHPDRTRGHARRRKFGNRNLGWRPALR